MKFLRKLLLVIFLPLLFIYASLWAVVHFKAKDIAVEKLELALNRDVNIKSIDLMPLFGLKVKGMEVDGLMKFEEFKVKLDILKSIKHGVGIKYVFLDELSVWVNKDKKGNYDLPFEISEETVASPDMPDLKITKKVPELELDKKEKTEEDVKTKKSKKEIGVYLGKLHIRDAKIIYTDKSKKLNNNVQLNLDNLKLKYISYPLETKNRFELNAGLKIANKILDDCINIKGWLDWPKRGMEATLKLESIPLEAIDVFLPSEYDAQSLGIEDAIFQLNADAVAKDNELDINALLSIPQYHYLQEPKDTTKALLTRSVIESLKKKTGTAEYEFKHRTKLDDPQLDIKQMKASMLKDKGSMTVDFGTTMVEQFTGKKTADFVEKLDPEEKAAVGAAGALLDSIMGTKAEGEEKGVISGFIDAYTSVEGQSQARPQVTNTTNAVPVVVEEGKDSQEQLEDVAIEVGVSLIKGLFD